MNTSAFKVAVHLNARAHFCPSTCMSVLNRSHTHVVVPRRSFATVSMNAEPEDMSVPQGFTAFSEQLNGRAAMLGFVLAVVTEALTGKGMVGQLNSLAKVLELVTPLSSFN